MNNQESSFDTFFIRDSKDVFGPRANSSPRDPHLAERLR